MSCYFGDELFFHLDLPVGYDKNSVKAAVYRQFSEKANKTLPWGILTGIRPAKIPLRMLFEGKTKEEVRECLKEEYLVSKAKISLVMDVAEKEYEMVKDLDEKTDTVSTLEFRSALPSASTVPFLLMITRVMPQRWMPI